MVTRTDEIVTEQTDGTQPATHENTPEETTPEAEEKITLTAKELNDRINKGRVDLGRTLKSALDAHSLLQRSFDAERAKITRLEESFRTARQKQREQELKSVEGTELIDSVRLKHQAEDEWDKVTKARSDFETERTQHLAELAELARTKAEKTANELAKSTGITADLLLMIGTDTADNGQVTYNTQRMQAIAKSVPKGEEKEEGEVAEAEGTPAVRGQRSLATGAGARSATRGLSTMQDYDEAYNQGRITTAEYSKARERFGVAY